MPITFDLSLMVDALAWGTAIAAILSMGVVEFAAGWTMWAVDRLAGFFGYDPYGRDDPDNYDNN